MTRAADDIRVGLTQTALQRRQQRMECARTRVAFPTLHVERLELPETERWQRGIDTNRYQLVCIARELRFVVNPVRVLRRRRPQYDDGVRCFDLAADLGVELHAGLDV